MSRFSPSYGIPKVNQNFEKILNNISINIPLILRNFAVSKKETS